MASATREDEDALVGYHLNRLAMYRVDGQIYVLEGLLFKQFLEHYSNINDQTNQQHLERYLCVLRSWGVLREIGYEAIGTGWET